MSEWQDYVIYGVLAAALVVMFVGVIGLAIPPSQRITVTVYSDGDHAVERGDR